MKFQIVIVEDDEPIAWMLTEQLRQERPDTRVYNFFDPFSALEHLRKQTPDLLITDLRMLGMSGFDLLHRMRQFAPDLPAILITADTSAETHHLSERYGVRAYLEKPFDFAALLQLVEQVLPEVPAPPTAPLAIPATANAAESDTLLELTELEEDWIPQTVETGSLLREAGSSATGSLNHPASAYANEEDSEEYWLETLLSDDFPAKGSIRLSIKGNSFGLPGKPANALDGLPYDDWCRELSQQLEGVQWCALVDGPGQMLVGSFCTSTNLAEAENQQELLTLADSLFGAGPLPRFQLPGLGQDQATPAQEVQLLYSAAVLVGKALTDPKLVLLLQSSNVQHAARLWEQLRGWLLLYPPKLAVSVSVVSQDQLSYSLKGTASSQLNGGLNGHAQNGYGTAVAERLESFAPGAPFILDNSGLFDEAADALVNRRVTKPLTLPVLEPETPATPAEPASAEPVDPGIVPPWPGLKPEAELVTPLWMADVLAAEVLPALEKTGAAPVNVALQPDVWTYRADKYCLRTSLQRCYPDLVAANKALQDCLKDRTALGELHASDTFFVLTPDAEGAYWLWTVTPWLVTLEAELVQALNTQDEVALAAALCKFAEAVLCSLQISMQKRLLLTVEPHNFATLYEGGPLVYIGDEIEHGYCLTEIGSNVLSRAAEFADWPRAVSVYLDVLGLGVCNRFNREQVRRLDLLRSLRDATVQTEGMLQAQNQLIERIRRCPE